MVKIFLFVLGFIICFSTSVFAEKKFSPSYVGSGVPNIECTIPDTNSDLDCKIKLNELFIFPDTIITKILEFACEDFEKYQIIEKTINIIRSFTIEDRNFVAIDIFYCQSGKEELPALLDPKYIGYIIFNKKIFVIRESLKNIFSVKQLSKKKTFLMGKPKFIRSYSIIYEIREDGIYEVREK